MTLNGVIPQVCVKIPNSVDFGAHYVKVVEDTPILYAAEIYRKNVVFSDISFMAILAGDHPQRER